MLYVVLALALILATLLLIRLRIRLEIARETRLLFVGLGRSGPEFDLARREVVIRLFGLRLGRIKLRPSPRPKSDNERRAGPHTEQKSVAAGRGRKIRAIMRILPDCLLAVIQYLIAGMKAAIVEQAEGEIEGGSGNPGLTGQLFGYYQAALAISPGLFGRVRFYPDWTGRSLSGSARVSVAWPVYRLVWETLLLLARLPKKEIYKLVIERKKGVRHVQ